MTDNISQLINNLSYKFSQTFTYNSRNPDDIFHFGRELKLNPDYVYTLKLNSYSGWNTLLNITDKKNKFQYSYDNGNNWKTITIPKGVWSFQAMDLEIKKQMKANDHYDSVNQKYHINIELNIPENRIILVISPNYKIDFNVTDSINAVFGYKKQIYNSGRTQAPNIPDITSTQAMFIIIDLIEPNILYSKNKSKYIQYVRSVPMYAGQIGSRHIIEDPLPQKYKILESKYNSSSCRIKLVDEDENVLDFGNEEFTIVFTVESA